MLDPPKNLRPETLPLRETQATQVSNAAPAAKPTECSQSSKAAPAAEPDEAACAASSLPGGHNTPKRFGVSASLVQSLQQQIYNSKVKQEMLEDALRAGKARLAEGEIVAIKLREAAEWLKLADMLDPRKNLCLETLPLSETQATQVSNAAPAPDERWKRRADQGGQCCRCERCGIMITIADVSLSGNCFYETDESFR